MKIALGADHAGVSLKNEVKRVLAELRFTVTDFGTKSDKAVDYPDFAWPVSKAVATGTHDRGILICGSGVGMAMAANKIAGVRAANVLDIKSAQLSREHNDVNVLALGAMVTTTPIALKIVQVFLNTSFLGGRHERRIAKIAELERRRDV
ncbi:MAG: ribose 5-phosphate isomerase B [Vicinamibacterales bacterium]|nr:ribose 5-phosphate isomerase B [Acidobacteriota bacterium]MDP7211132.1 ribose 5-phosphate isomerase B [Vicinamibacterales bacterium]HJO16696.1 ribose 5-phosphate isomerase B [Vicinamibacterales bacterium]